MLDVAVIDAMKMADRFPIPEALVGREERKSYNLRVDSLISSTYNIDAVNEWADYRQELDAPYNSMESEEEFPLHDSEESDENEKYPYIPKNKLEE